MSDYLILLNYLSEIYFNLTFYKNNFKKLNIKIIILTKFQIKKQIIIT